MTRPTPTTVPPGAHIHAQIVHAATWASHHQQSLFVAAVATIVAVWIVKWRVGRWVGYRKSLRDGISQPFAGALGCPVHVRKCKIRERRVTYMKLHWEPHGRENSTAVAGIQATIEGRMARPVALHWDPPNRNVTITAKRAEKPVEDPSGLLPRAEHLVRQLLGPDATIEGPTFKVDGRFLEFQVRHKSIKDPDREFRLNVDHVIQDKLGQRLDPDWDKFRDRIIYRAIPDLPTYVPHPITTTTDDRHIPFAVDAKGNSATWDLGYAAHCLIVGQTGSGKSVTVFTLVTELTARGIPVRACDPKMIGLLGLVGWPNVTLSTDTDAIIATILDTEAEMKRRFQAVLAGQVKEADLEPLVLLVDELWTAFKQIDAAWANRGEKTKDDPKVAPARDALTNMLRMGRQGRVHVICAIQRPDAKIFDGAEARNNFGCAIVCGSPDAATTRMLGFTTTISNAPKGRAVVDTGHGEREVQVWVTPDPADYRKLKPLEQEIIDNLRAAAERALPNGYVKPAPLPTLRLVTRAEPDPEPVPAAPAEVAKRCSTCRKTETDGAEFGTDRSRPDGLSPRCRACERQRAAAIRAERAARRAPAPQR